MARSANQKLKLLYLMGVLLEQSDEDHPLTIAQLIAYLAEKGISAERKSIYDDLEALRVFGLDIVQVKSHNTGYYVGCRRFDQAELKLLADSVQSSKFITNKKAASLIKKIGDLTSTHQGSILQRHIYVRNRIKSMSQSVYSNVDCISEAINDDRSIRFRYFEYAVDKERKFRRNGERYLASPFMLIWDDEKYYVLAWDEEAAMLKHYSVDKMTCIEITDQPRTGKDAFAQLDMSAYCRMEFGMFAGNEQQVVLRFANYLAGDVLDRFGKEISLEPCDEENFTVSVLVEVNPQFFSWLFAFGMDAEILLPAHVRREMRRRALDIADLCR